MGWSEIELIGNITLALNLSTYCFFFSSKKLKIATICSIFNHTPKDFADEK